MENFLFGTTGLGKAPQFILSWHSFFYSYGKNNINKPSLRVQPPNIGRSRRSGAPGDRATISGSGRYEATAFAT